MPTVVRREVRKRGFFGWVFLLIFLAFNAFMAIWIIDGLVRVSGVEPESEAARVGAAIGTALGVGTLVVLWTCGAVITGLLALLTRGRKTIVTETVRGGP